MARSKGTLSGLSGLIGPVVLKQYATKTVITSKPDMTRVRRTTKQKTNALKFADAVLFARTVLYDPAKKLQFEKKLKKGQSVYHAALSDYLLRNS
jgi:hypothetical protein